MNLLFKKFTPIIHLNMFYTYAHFRPDGRIFYIGKGSGDRHLSSNRGRYWKNIVAKEGGFRSEILARWSSETEAFEHEKFLIRCFKDLGFELCNLTDGGEGTSGIVFSEEERLKRSRALVGKKKSDETRAKMSAFHLANPKPAEKLALLWVGRKHSAETREKMSIAAKRRNQLKLQIAEGAMLCPTNA
jgi:hypothetical protein